ncbi:MAG: hypothetical protein ED558_14095 [Oricola sp.]|nr:MAG: hypothetical protein ED558_14095 [Oricola sp.]
MVQKHHANEAGRTATDKQPDVCAPDVGRPGSPFGGSPTRTDYVARRLLEGATRRQIARELGVSLGAISGFVALAKQRTKSTTQTAMINAGLRWHAEKRGMSVGDLKRRLLLTIARERMVDAVLDDGATRSNADPDHWEEFEARELTGDADG